MDKRGQVSLYIVVGLLVVAAVVYFGFIRETRTDEETGVAQQDALVAVAPSDMKTVKQYTETCLKDVAKQALYKWGEQGGYIERPPELKIIYTSDRQVTYLNYQGQNIVPDITYIEADFERYMDEQMRYCLKDYKFFQEKGYSVIIDKPKSEVKIAPEALQLKVKLPLNFEHEDEEAAMEDFVLSYPIDLNAILSTAQDLITAAPTDPSPFKRGDFKIYRYDYPNSARKLWKIGFADFGLYFATE